MSPSEWTLTVKSEGTCVSPGRGTLTVIQDGNVCPSGTDPHSEI